MSLKILFFDLELSQAIATVWNTGKQYVGHHQLIEPQKIISYHWKWSDSDKVQNMDWGLHKQCDKKIIKQIKKDFDRADLIVAHNGNRFDMKKVYGRAMYHGIILNPKYVTFDTMVEVKRLASLPSYSLAFLCKHFGLPFKLDSGGKATWDQVQFDKSREALDHLLYYGDGDITSLEALYYHIRPYTQAKIHAGVLRGGERYHCPSCERLANYKSMYVTAAGTVQHWLQCSDRKVCKSQWKVNNKTYQDYMQYKIRNGIK